jgi:hypothetical protein
MENDQMIDSVMAAAIVHPGSSVIDATAAWV